MTWRRIVMTELDREEGSRMERKRWIGGGGGQERKSEVESGRPNKQFFDLGEYGFRVLFCVGIFHLLYGW